MPQRAKALAWFGPVQPECDRTAQLAGRDFLAAAHDHLVGAESRCGSGAVKRVQERPDTQLPAKLARRARRWRSRCGDERRGVARRRERRRVCPCRAAAYPPPMPAPSPAMRMPGTSSSPQASAAGAKQSWCVVPAVRRAQRRVICVFGTTPWCSSTGRSQRGARGPDVESCRACAPCARLPRQVGCAPEGGGRLRMRSATDQAQAFPQVPPCRARRRPGDAGRAVVDRAALCRRSRRCAHRPASIARPAGTATVRSRPARPARSARCRRSSAGLRRPRRHHAGQRPARDRKRPSIAPVASTSRARQSVDLAVFQIMDPARGGDLPHSCSGIADCWGRCANPAYRSNSVVRRLVT